MTPAWSRRFRYPRRGDFLEIRLRLGASHPTEPHRPTASSRGAGLVSRLAEELALALGCPVEVSYLKVTREVVAVAHVEPGREIRLTLPVSLIGVGLIDDPYAALKYHLLKQLRCLLTEPSADG